MVILFFCQTSDIYKVGKERPVVFFLYSEGCGLILSRKTWTVPVQELNLYCLPKAWYFQCITLYSIFYLDIVIFFPLKQLE